MHLKIQQTTKNSYHVGRLDLGWLIACQQSCTAMFVWGRATPSHAASPSSFSDVWSPPVATLSSAMITLVLLGVDMEFVNASIDLGNES